MAAQQYNFILKAKSMEIFVSRVIINYNLF